MATPTSNQGNQGGNSGNQRTTPSGSTTNSNSPGQGGGGQDQGQDDSQVPATGSSRRSTNNSGGNQSSSNQGGSQGSGNSGSSQGGNSSGNQGSGNSSDQGNQSGQGQQRRGQGDIQNQQGDAEDGLGIYMAIPSSERPGQYVEFDNLSPEGAHELTGMYMKANMNISRGGFESQDQGSNQGSGNNFSGETELTAKYGHSGTPGKSLAPDSKDGRKTSPIRGGKGEGINQQGGDSNS